MVGSRTTRRIANSFAVALICAATSSALASSGIFKSFVVVDTGSGNVFYDMQPTTANIDWNGLNLGAFNAGGSTNGSNTLTLNGGELNTFQNSGDDIPVC